MKIQAGGWGAQGEIMVAKWQVGRNNLRKGAIDLKDREVKYWMTQVTKGERSLDGRDKGNIIKKQNSPC